MLERPPHVSPGLVVVVAIGGALGTLARVVATELWGEVTLLPTLTVNVVGSFLLGVLLESLARRAPGVRADRALRAGLGTGFLGGLTTFSALALEVERLAADGDLGPAAVYGLGSLGLGLAACVAGVLLAARSTRRTAAAGAAQESPGC